jgi:hypothetical protein
MLVGVAGGRNYDRWAVVHGTLSKFHCRYGITGMIQGEAKGADFAGKTWATNNGVPLICRNPNSLVPAERTGFPAKWDVHGNAAGWVRNREMAQQGPDLFLIFPGGKGTRQMRDIAVEFEIPTLVIPDRAWELAQEPDEPIITFDDEDERPSKQSPYWAFKPKPNQRWEVIDHAAIAARKAHVVASAERYAEESMF